MAPTLAVVALSPIPHRKSVVWYGGEKLDLPTTSGCIEPRHKPPLSLAFIKITYQSG